MYRVKNWPAYDIALRDRGNITVWFGEEAICSWNAPPSGHPGGQRRYSNLAIVTALTLRTVFHLPLRQTEGFLASLIGLMDRDLKTPDHTTLSRRNRDVEVPPFSQSSGPLHLVIDSTGLKILGDGEWQSHKHKTSNKRRSWRKLHLGVDGDGYIIASALTDRIADDGCVAISMLEQIKGSITRFTADGAYDSRPMYDALATARATNLRVVIPPMKTATVDARATGVWRQRNQAIERIGEVGRRQWRKESGAHRQARAENGMYRYKRIIGDSLRARHPDAQKTEALVAVSVINRMTTLGMPESAKIVA
jgi:IS5 family transposase